MSKDLIVEEIRQIRDAHAKKFNYNLDEIFRDLKAKENAGGRTYLRGQPRPAKPIPRSKMSDQ